MLSLLTGRSQKLSQAARTTSLQEKFEQLQKANSIGLKLDPIDLSELNSFHVEKMSKINELLRYARVDQKVLLMVQSGEADNDEQLKEKEK